MAEQKEKKERKLTPIGEAKWAHLNEPKKPFKDKGDPKYQIDVVFDPNDPEWKIWVEHVINAIKELPQQINKKTGEKILKQSPIKRELNQVEEPTGRYYVTFKTSDKYKPAIFDRYGKLLEDVNIGNGSKVRVAYIENEYEAFGGGINFYFNAVQVLELIEYGKRSAVGYGFDVEPQEESELQPF